MNDSSRPPPVTDPRASVREPETLEDVVRRHRGDHKQLEAMTVEHGNRLDDLEQLVGRAPSALPGDRGTGLAQHLVDLTLAVNSLRDSVEGDRKARAAAAEQAAKQREPYSRGGWLAFGALISAVVGLSAAGAFHWLATLHH